MKVVILAGGYGTRISEESHLRPKPMIEIGEKPILWHIAKYYSAFGFNEFIICCGYKGYMIKEYFADYYLHRSDVTFDFSNGGKMTVHANVSEPWKVTLVDTGADSQTGGRIKRIASYIGNERFMLTYGDGVSDIDLNALLKQHGESGATMTLTAIQSGGRFGVLEIEGDNVTAFKEKAKEDGGWINAGFMVAEPELFGYIDNDYTILERAPLERLSAGRKLGVYKHRGFWACMDTQRDKSYLEAAWANGKAKWKVWED
ncbi:MAG: glucose-1-phosphate cytidylyltransferase [Oscillospiraceae bacterium]|jgi:glucose-1-phosphate cytidylyltransferase|nr:glucose-1-phosphate cytidylyltransferase [Oscillospiraceae bacterium]